MPPLRGWGLGGFGLSFLRRDSALDRQEKDQSQKWRTGVSAPHSFCHYLKAAPRALWSAVPAGTRFFVLVPTQALRPGLKYAAAPRLGLGWIWIVVSATRFGAGSTKGVSHQVSVFIGATVRSGPLPAFGPDFPRTRNNLLHPDPGRRILARNKGCSYA